MAESSGWIAWKTGVVLHIEEQRGTVQELTVRTDDGRTERAIHYADALPPVRIGDRVKLNATAVELGLGSGGYHFVHDIMNGETSSAEAPDRASRDRDNARGHIMKLRYTPAQRAILAAEEPASPFHGLFTEPLDLQGMPVLIGELHSMLPVALCWLRGAKPVRTVYIMTDGAALPLAFSRHVALLRQAGWLQGTVTYGHAYGGDLETVNKFTALIAARHALQAQIAFASMGPGIVGTGTPFGHTATETAELVHAVHALGGVPVVVARIGFADPRPRHRGLSHHLLAVLGKLTLVRAALPLPASLPAEERRCIERQLADSGCADRHDVLWVSGVAAREIAARLQAYPEPITTMGKGLRDDPHFFASVCAAAQHALSIVSARR